MIQIVLKEYSTIAENELQVGRSWVEPNNGKKPNLAQSRKALLQETKHNSSTNIQNKHRTTTMTTRWHWRPFKDETTRAWREIWQFKIWCERETDWHDNSSKTSGDNERSERWNCWKLHVASVRPVRHRTKRATTEPWIVEATCTTGEQNRAYSYSVRNESRTTHWHKTKRKVTWYKTIDRNRFQFLSLC